MWPNSYKPDFVLPPNHARLFCAGLGYLSDQVGWQDSEDHTWEGSTPVFARLTQGQKQVALLEVARALLREDVEAPNVTAVLAATVAEVYDILIALIEFEIDREEPSTELRRLVLAALEEADLWTCMNDARPPGEERASPPSGSCGDIQEWEALIEALQTEILEDRDFAMEDTFMDADPEATTTVKDTLNIDADYFTAIPEDPPRKKLQAVRQELHELLEAKGEIR